MLILVQIVILSCQFFIFYPCFLSADTLGNGPKNVQSRSKRAIEAPPPRSSVAQGVAPLAPNEQAQNIKLKYEPVWESLEKRPIPSWYEDAKFGIFIHWGVYSVPSYVGVGTNGLAEWFWYYQTSGTAGGAFHTQAALESVKNFMHENYPPDFKYQDFAQYFTAEFYDPVHWAEILRKSGARYCSFTVFSSIIPCLLVLFLLCSFHCLSWRISRKVFLSFCLQTSDIMIVLHISPPFLFSNRYVVLTSKHHDGFTMWPSKKSWNWNVMDNGPHRDLVGDLEKAVRTNTDLKFGLYHSLYEWFNPMYLDDKANMFKTQTYVKVGLFLCGSEPLIHYAFKCLFKWNSWICNSTIYYEISLSVGILYFCTPWLLSIEISLVINFFKCSNHFSHWQEKLGPELREIVEKYKPEIVWSDGQWEAPCEYFNCTQFLAWLYNDRSALFVLFGVTIKV